MRRNKNQSRGRGRITATRASAMIVCALAAGGCTGGAGYQFLDVADVAPSSPQALDREIRPQRTDFAINNSGPCGDPDAGSCALIDSEATEPLEPIEPGFEDADELDDDLSDDILDDLDPNVDDELDDDN